MAGKQELYAIYNQQLDLLLLSLDKRKPLDARIGSAANTLNLALREVRREVPSAVAAGMSDLSEDSTVTELISHAATLKAILYTYLYGG